MNTIVIVRTSFVGFHYWSEAPDDVSFLRDEHRHVFFVEVGFNVGEVDRQIEFFQAKMYLIECIEVLFPLYDRPYAGARLGSLSCEVMAKLIIRHLKKRQKFSDVNYVSVFEDDENGAKVIL